MSNRLGVEMTVLRPKDRTSLMKGMVLRRLVAGKPLTKSQLDVGIEQDVFEIQKRFKTFEFESYVGCELDVFYDSMTVGQLINHRTGNDGKTLYERGSFADDFDKGLSPDMEWMVESLPMSTRGLFDKLKSKPDRSVTVRASDVADDHKTGKKQIIVDHSDQAQRALRDGPIIRP